MECCKVGEICQIISEGGLKSSMIWGVNVIEKIKKPIKCNVYPFTFTCQ